MKNFVFSSKIFKGSRYGEGHPLNIDRVWPSLELLKIMNWVSDDEIIFNQEIISSYVFGFLSAFISGIFACKWMIVIVKKSKMKYFSLYCLAVGLICIFFSL